MTFLSLNSLSSGCSVVFFNCWELLYTLYVEVRVSLQQDFSITCIKNPSAWSRTLDFKHLASKVVPTSILKHFFVVLIDFQSYARHVKLISFQPTPVYLKGLYGFITHTTVIVQKHQLIQVTSQSHYQLNPGFPPDQGSLAPPTRVLNKCSSCYGYSKPHVSCSTRLACIQPS